jgi:hypothetical protein
MDRDRFEIVLSLYVDGRATAEDLAQLEAAMTSDPSLRREFVERMRLEVSLTSLFAASAEARRPEGTTRTERTATPSRRLTARSADPRRRFSRRSWGIPLGIAAALLMAALLLRTSGDAGSPSAPPGGGAGSAAPVTERNVEEGVRGEEARTVLEEARRAAEEERARAEVEQKASESQLAALQRRELESARERAKDGDLSPRTGETDERLRKDREVAEAQLREAQARERRAAAEVARMGKELAQPLPVGGSPETRTDAARIDRVEGEAYVVGASGRTAAAPGRGIRPEESVECAGPRTVMLLSFPDRTRVELGGNTIVREISDPSAGDPGRPAQGKRLFLEKGTVKAEVARQPKDHPMVFATPQGEARVLGTTLRLDVSPDSRKGTTLDVEEGKVELRNPAGKGILVEGGRQAAIATGVPFVARALPREEVLLSLDLEDGKLPSIVDTGTVEPGPLRPGSRFCLAGMADPGGTCKILIGDGANGLFTFQGDEVLSFDYWADPQAAQVNFNFWDRTQKVSHEGMAPKLVTGKWTRVVIRLADLGDPGTRLREGDWVINLYLQSAGVSPRRFYVDNLLITRTRMIRPKPLDTRSK